MIEFEVLDEFCKFIEGLKPYEKDLQYPQYAEADLEQNHYCFRHGLPMYVYMHRISFYDKLKEETNKLIENIR